ncbi:MAG: diaminopimelate epimerase [Bacteroidota bacterium]
MHILFHKYHGTGNDFILIDQRKKKYLAVDDQQQIERLCHRHFGIGADGLILLQNHAELDFEMVYFNSDGCTSSMCGNGGRCIVAFAHYLGVFEDRCEFMAVDGAHQARIKADGWVELKMGNVKGVDIKEEGYFLQTGSPHVVQFVEQMEDVNIVHEGRAIRYSEPYAPGGSNVNFVQIHADYLQVATYERGVENETLSCGTGVTAAALAYAFQKKDQSEVAIRTKGGDLIVQFEQDGDTFNNIWLCGATKRVFEGVFVMDYKS